MMMVLEILLCLFLAVWIISRGWHLLFASTALLVLVNSAFVWSEIPRLLLILCDALIIATAIFFLLPTLRRGFLSKPVFRFMKKALPPMSQTEREALDAGDIWWEAELFRGNPNWNQLFDQPKPTLSTEEQAFMDNQVEELCGMLDDWKIVHEDRDLPPAVWAYLKKERFFGMVMSKDYGGLGFSALAHSWIVAKIATRSVSAAVTVMVPNSLGPGELITHYGTDDQKQHYLPRLASGDEIPCFGLTSSEAGSDAAAMTDHALICRGEHDGKEVIGLKLNFEKRYITLAPIATVVGLAIKVFDPEHLLSEEDARGITLCLLPAKHVGVEIGARHRPMNLAFMNGTIRGKDVFIPLDWIIGGEKMIGQGWRMLMECLSIGRAISLPAVGAAGAKLAFRTTGAYARLRKQFKVSIGNFEGVAEQLGKIGALTYLTEASRVMTASAVDQGVKPSVASAIAKYHLTEMNRTIINDAMDIHAGRAVQMGPNNYLAHPYWAIPVGITVEGANILTRNLMIFGQGAIRCHPFLRHEMDCSQEDTPESFKRFDGLLSKHVGYTVSNAARCFLLGLTGARSGSAPASGPTAKYYRQLNHLSAALAFISDVAMLTLGGQLKRREQLSARLGDMLSYLYLGSAALKFYRDHGEEKEDLLYVHWILRHCLHQASQALQAFLRNFPVRWLGKTLRFLVLPWGERYHAPPDCITRGIADHMMKESALRDRLGEGCFIGDPEKDDPLAKLESAWQGVLSTSEQEKKLNQFVKENPATSPMGFHDWLARAKEAEVLTKEEAEQLATAHAGYWDAIQVDEFNER